MALRGHESGARVRNAYATYPMLADSPEKFGLSRHEEPLGHPIDFKYS